ncbi:MULTISPECIES: LysR family transcriptional regulator [unclassified Ensifer]|uniref:LysR family transcriptional regulator n=1 Tax=unclassified Ensifer TaxID=2633371 RepID=UPI000812E68D|nr:MULTISPECIES: LysR family transcriptional regulator [unclassified Ensifer]OCP01757.1 LysR family transcriptional regulator [Ensifer sp. LC14]OCP09546.1 LysR family transcriptional regulator [Ensifer sp. LC13]OCP10716.1 LysR family transcriptional regulator [Ensifer sp. LC11]OCP32794.1 LysR family transcriptional regulator [Ensifer sp. LC499]
MSALNLDYLRTFALVAELGSFSAAAERLGLTQPAISLQVRALEKQLGVRLVERVGRTARPSAAGAELLAHVDRIEAVTSQALEAVARHARGVFGRVRIGTGATPCAFLLPPLLAGLKRRFPDLDITVTTGNSADIVRAVDENLLDIGLVTLPVAGRIFDIEPLLEERFAAIAPLGTDLPDSVTAAILAKYPMILYEPGANTRRITDDWLMSGGTNVKPLMSFGSVDAIKEMVAAGLGAALVPEIALRTEDRERLEVRPVSPPFSRRSALVLRRDKRLDRALRETLAALRTLANLEEKMQ